MNSPYDSGRFLQFHQQEKAEVNHWLWTQCEAEGFGLWKGLGHIQVEEGAVQKGGLKLSDGGQLIFLPGTAKWTLNQQRRPY